MKALLKKGFNFWVNEEGFPKLEVGKAYRISFDFYPNGKEEGFFDNASIKLLSVPDDVKIKP